MKRMTFLWKTALSVLLITMAAACDKDDKPIDNTEGLQVVNATTSRVTSYGDDWIYFSFKEGKEVAVSEENHASSLAWDIAFNRYNIRTNSGKSGAGQGGACDAGKVDFDNYTTAPTDGYTVDGDFEISDVGSGFPPPTKMSTANTVLCKAIAFSGPPPAYTPSEHVYAVKTADGKYAKLYVKSFYDTQGNSGIVSFKYVYQSNGSTTFK